ncbi:MAG: DNA translocase FtsK [Candidatus Paceibacterota bacterium]
MAKGKKKKSSTAKDKQQSLTQKLLLGNQSSPVRSAIAGVLIAAAAGFLVLAAFESAGFVGDTVRGWLAYAFGTGYWFFVAGLIFFAYALLRRSANLPTLTWVHTVSAIILFLTILGLIDVAAPEAGGIIGALIAGGVISAFSVYAGVILLQTVAVVSLLILVDEYVDLSRQINLPALSSLGLSSTAEDEEEQETEGEMKVTNTAQTNQSTSQSAESREATKDSSSDPESSDDDRASGTTKGKDGAGFSVTKPKKHSEASFTASPPLKGDYTPPPVELLSRDTGDPEVGDVKARANLIKRTLENFNIDVEMDEVSIGPTVTRYALKPAEGVRLNRITNLQNNLEMALAAHPVRIEAPIPGKSLVGVEVPNTSKTTVGLAGLMGSKRFQDDPAPLLMGLGQGISGETYFSDLNKMPHLLIGGATGAGKSVTVHVLMNSLLFRNGPDNLKLIMVDPKRVELTLYNGIPHLLTPVITSAKKAILALKWAAKEMDRRYDILEENGARDISSYHKTVLPKLKKQHTEGEQSPDTMPYIVIVIDEMADMMSVYPKELEAVIVRIAQMSRAVGIHLILSTQRPDVSIITGIIKANIPARIALQVSSQIDSRTILDTKGAEQLLGAGDMLFQTGDMSKPVRIQSAYITEGEVKKVVKHLKDQYADQLQDTVSLKGDGDGDGGKTIFDVAAEAEEDEERDDKYEEALETVVKAGKASTSHLQRKLRVGYSRAARIIDELEENGVISEKDGTRARDVLITHKELEAARAGETITHEDSSDDSSHGEGSGETKEDSHTVEQGGAGDDDPTPTSSGDSPNGGAGSGEGASDPQSSDDDRANEEIDDKYFEALEEDE